jgi:hypothetical protein
MLSPLLNKFGSFVFLGIEIRNLRCVCAPHGRVHTPNFGLLFNDFSHQPNHLARFRVTVSLELGIDQLIVYLDLEPASVRRDQGQDPDLILELFEQVVCQAHGPVGVVSNRTVDDFDI